MLDTMPVRARRWKWSSNADHDDSSGARPDIGKACTAFRREEAKPVSTD